MKIAIKVALFLVVTLFVFDSNAQVIGQKLNTGGSIFYEGFSIGSEFTDKKITFDFVGRHEFKTTRQKKKKLALMFGLSASGKNNDNILDIFKSGDFSTSSKLGLNIGLEIEKSKPNDLVDLYTKYLEKDKKLAGEIFKIDKKLKDFLITELDNIKDSNNSFRIEAIKSNLEAQYKSVYKKDKPNDNSNYKSFEKIIKTEIRDTVGGFTKIPKIKKHLVEKLDSFVITYKSDIDKKLSLIADKAAKANSIYLKEKDLKKYKLVPYITASLLGDKFKFLDNIMGEFKTIDTSDVGGFIGIGLNLESRNWIFGFRATNDFENNFEILTKKTFSSEKVEIIDGIEQKSKTEVTAYEGDFRTLSFSRFVVDFMIFSNLGDKYKIAINPFFRHSDSSDDNISPNITDIGISANFFEKKEGKFLAGLYLVASDLANNEAAFKEIDKKSIFNRLNFGISASYVLNDFSEIFAKSSVRNDKSMLDSF